jgi:hypothetical protein
MKVLFRTGERFGYESAIDRYFIRMQVATPMSFHPSQLHVVAVVSNPLRFASRVRLTQEFCSQQLEAGVSLTLVECALGERAFMFEALDARINFVGVRHTTLLWHKENLINIGLSRLPRDAKYVAWIDADVMFRSPTWAVDIIHALQQYSIIQPWTAALDLGPNGEVLEMHTSFCSLWIEGKPIFPQWKKGYTFGHPGYAWAARIEILQSIGGLYEGAILGSADHNWALSLLGRAAETFPSDISPEFTASQLSYQARAKHFAGQRIGRLGGTIEHSFHGPKRNRAYVSRWDILRKWKYNPVTDVRHNLDRVIELCGNKPGLQKDIEQYFSSRFEDSNEAR